ncbi:MAG: alpha amylase family protein [Armatimonadota bacterium]
MTPLLALLAATPVVIEARILWVDMSANLPWTLDPQRVAEFCENAANSGFNELVVDVKSINGKRLFGPPGEERLREFRGFAIPEEYDLLAVFADEGHKRGLRVSAGLNVFSEGHSHFAGVGMAYERPETQTVVAVPYHELLLNDGSTLTVSAEGEPRPGVLVTTSSESGIVVQEANSRVLAVPEDAERLASVGVREFRYGMRLLPQTEALPSHVAVFVDPLAPGVTERMLSMVEQVARYPIDGIVFDRMRYADLASGMGPSMRAEFERIYGKTAHWPGSVLAANPVPGRAPIIGPRFAEYMQFRAEIINRFLAQAVATAKRVNPRLTVGSYVGGGWETYYQVGVNYATDEPEGPYPWALAEYGLAGYAGYLDLLMTGCFYPVAREVDATIQGRRERFTVEACAKLTTQLSGEGTLVYPSLYGLDWEGNVDGLRNAIQACLREGAGIMVFDAVYVVRNDWWGVFREEFGSRPAISPHALPSYPRRTHRRAVVP